MTNGISEYSVRSAPQALLPRQQQRIGTVRHPPPLRIVVGLEAPDLALGRLQQEFAALDAPYRGAKAVTSGSQRGFRYTAKFSGVFVSVLVRVTPQIDLPLPRTIAQSPIS